MTLTQLVQDAWVSYKGKSSSVPQSGSVKYTDILAIINRKQRERAIDPNTDWPDLYQERSSGVLSTGVQTYNLDTDILRLTDYVLVGTTTKVSVIKTAARSRYTSGCYLYGSNPKQLTFIATIGTNYNGQTLRVPAIIEPTALVSGTDTVNPAIAQWLTYAVAAELARNDYAKEEQYSNIIGQANDLYTKMADDAQMNSFLQPNGVLNNMPQPSSLEYNNYAPGAIL